MYTLYAFIALCAVLPLSQLTPVAGEEKAKEWGYKPESKYPPEKWSELYESCADNGEQSPIDVVTENIKTKKFGLASNYRPDPNLAHERKFENDGRNVNMSYVCCSQTAMSGGAMPNPTEKYYFFYALFFFGDSSSGSPHTIDGKGSPMEAQLFYHKRNADGTADMSADTFALAVFYKEVPEDNHDLDGIITHTNQIQKFNQQVVHKITTDMSQMRSFFVPAKYRTKTANIADYFNNYYHYKGSLPTPPCTGNVYWHLMKEQVEIGTNELQALRQLKDENGQSIAGNRRPVQSLGKREVLSSDPSIVKKP